MDIRKPFATLAVAATLALAHGTAAAAPSTAAIDRIVRRAQEEFRVPGMSVAVVHDGRVRHAAGHGTIAVGAREVGQDTLFQIGSLSKAFTTAALALLVDAGQLGWDDRVIDHLPEFRMYDPWVTREFTVRDLLTHRSGLPLGAGDLLLFPDGRTTRREVVLALRHLPPASSFRSRYAYDNLLYIVAGEVAARVSGMEFEDFLEQRLLHPLGMHDCAATAARVAPDAVLATPHLLIDGELQTTSTRMGALVAAAGGITCSARSMARWMSFVLARGVTADGTRLLSEAQFDQLLEPVTPVPLSGFVAEHSGAHLAGYALGWVNSTFHGQPLLSHSGGVWGMTSFLAVMPRQQLAVFVSGNQMSAAPRALAFALLELHLGKMAPRPARDWIAIVAEATRARAAHGADTVAAAAAARAADSSPNLPLASYAGTYRDAWYGAVQIELRDDGRLWFRSERNPPLSGPLEHFQYDTFIARWSDRQLLADAYVSFSLAPEGSVERIRMRAVSPTTDFSFDFHDLDLKRQHTP